MIAYEIIEDECTACGICIDKCHIEAISERKEFYTIDAYICTDCAACANVCSNGVI